ncbi:hypothetical protein [Halomonas litopenaei]|uniref:hypothetical protein n=1 Tax=Halomonas litopenaei TaxID=2109328 RepID=UPI003F9FC094
MTEKVFYSWQSDSPGNTNRNLISTALESAIEEVRSDESIEVEPVIDRDTLGLSGSPDISQSIFSKIDQSSAFVCDVSILDSKAKKPSPNPNVLIELGYAVKVLSWDRVILVMNTKYGNPELLPFDLRSRRVLTYNVSKDAEEKAPARNLLRKTLVVALKSIFENHGPMNAAPVKPEHVEGPADVDRELFEEFKATLPSKGGISFIDEQNMAGFSWPRENLKQLEKFYHEWDDAEHEFLSNDLESLRSKLHQLIGDYLGQIAVNTFPANNPDRQTVPSEWELENPKRFFDVVNSLHETAGEIVKTHQDLIRVGRKRLGV